MQEPRFKRVIENTSVVLGVSLAALTVTCASATPVLADSGAFAGTDPVVSPGPGAVSADDVWVTQAEMGPADGEGSGAEAGCTQIVLLEGRLQACFPIEAELSPRGYSIMAAAPQDAVESRVVWDVGTRRMVVMVTEGFFTSDGSPIDAATGSAVMGSQVTAESLMSSRGLAMTRFTPVERDLSREAILLSSVVVTDNDGLGIFFDTYVNPEWSDALDEALAVSEAIASSLELGARTIEAEARTIDVGRFTQGTGMVVFDVSDGTYSYTQPGPDFDLLFFGALEPLADEEGWSGLIYVGGHPNIRPRTDAVQTEGTVLGSDVTWTRYESDGGWHEETWLRPLGSQRLGMHIILSAREESALDVARLTVDALREEPP